MSELGQTTDELNELLLEAEERLRLMNTGVAANVSLDAAQTLSFRKSGNKWRLMVFTSGIENYQPLMEMPRQTRCIAAERLSDLRDALIAEHDKQVLEVRHATDTVHRFLDSFAFTSGG